MIRSLIRASLEFRFLVLFVAFALIAAGTLGVRRMPVDVLPEFAPPIVEVQTEAMGLSADEVETLITFGLEQVLSGVPWLESSRSRSVTGLSTITLIFKRGTDLMKARQLVQERLALAYDMPNVANPPVILQPVSATGRFMMIGISSETLDPTELSLLARWTIKPRLAGVPGVANVAIWGQRLRQMHVHIHPDRLRDAKLVQEDIITAAGDALWVSPLTFLKASAPGAGGWIDNRNQRLGVEHAMPIETPRDMAKVPVVPDPDLQNGRVLSLGDVTEIMFAHPPLIGDAFVNGGNGLLLVLEKFPAASTSEVTRNVEAALGELSRGLPGVKIDTTVFKLASYLDDAFAHLRLAILVAAVLVALVAAVSLRSWRRSVVALVAIAVSMLAALFALYLMNATINTMVIAGLMMALAVVIDDAMGDTAEDFASAGLDISPASAIRFETRSASIYSALIAILAVLPIFFIGGISGAFFEPLALAYTVAVIASMLVALTITPALWAMLAAGALSRECRLRERYERAVHRMIIVPAAVLSAIGVVVIACAALWPFFGQSLLPAFKERELVVDVTTPPGTSRTETQRITARISRELLTLKGVRNVGAHVGRAVTGDQVVGVNSSQIWVSVDASADYDSTVASVRDTIEGYPGIERSVHTYLRSTLSEALTGEAKAIVVRIYGPKRDVLRQKAEEVSDALSNINGVADLRIDGQVEEPQVQVKVKLDAAGRASVKPGDVRRASSTIFSGIVVGYLFKEQKIFEVVVWGAPEARQSLTSLRDLWIDKPDRDQVRLSDIADIAITPTPTVIKHERIAPYIDVVANVATADAGSVANQVRARLSTMSFPLEHHPELLGEFAERENAQHRTFGVAIVCLLGIFLLLQACFRSWGLALIVFLALPVSIAGGLVAILAAGGVVSLGSTVGFLAVLGIAARHGVLLVRHYQRLEERKHMPLDAALLVRGASERSTLIAASSACVIAALLPILFMGKLAGLEIAQPIAVVMIGGLMASTLYTLLVVPALLARFSRYLVRERDLALGLTR